MRNAQMRMLALMPLILIVIRLLNSSGWKAVEAMVQASRTSF